MPLESMNVTPARSTTTVSSHEATTPVHARLKRLDLGQVELSVDENNGASAGPNGNVERRTSADQPPCGVGRGTVDPTRRDRRRVAVDTVIGCPIREPGVTLAVDGDRLVAPTSGRNTQGGSSVVRAGDS
jgi:hypothetical protein